MPPGPGYESTTEQNEPPRNVSVIVCAERTITNALYVNYSCTAHWHVFLLSARQIRDIDPVLVWCRSTVHQHHTNTGSLSRFSRMILFVFLFENQIASLGDYNLYLIRKLEHFWFNVGPASGTLDQHWANIGKILNNFSKDCGSRWRYATSTTSRSDWYLFLIW